MPRILQGLKPKDRAARKALKLQLFRNRFRRAGEAIIREETQRQLANMRYLQAARKIARRKEMDALAEGLKQISQSTNSPEANESHKFRLVRSLANEIDPKDFRQKVRQEKRLFSQIERDAEVRRQSYVLKELKPLGPWPTLKKGTLNLKPLDVHHHMEARTQKAWEKLRERRLKQRKR